MSSASPLAAYDAGLAHASAGRHAEAIEAFEIALAQSPEDLRVLFALGCSARDIGHYQAAEAFYRRVLAYAPDRIEALVSLANVLRARGDVGSAISLLKPAIERQPQWPELWLTLGSALRESGDRMRAEIFYREALRLDPDYPPALGNLADLLSDADREEEAFLLYEQALKQKPDPQTYLNRAILFLRRGELKQGWEDYEYRLQLPSAPHYQHGLATWDGSSLTGKRLLVTAEQGIGDLIAFASLIPELCERAEKEGGHIIVETEKRLTTLFARSFPKATIHAMTCEKRGGRNFSNYAWLSKIGGANIAITLGSLPNLLRGSLGDFPAQNVFLMTDKAEKSLWQLYFSMHANAAPLIGLCWRSGKATGLRGLQYAPIEAWGQFISELPGSPVVLQYDATADEIATLEKISGRTLVVPDNLDQKQEIDRSCAMMASLDAVITAPTAVAWQSASLGIPTLKILYNISWTAFGQTYEPLAPAAKLMMPETSGDWASAFAKAQTALSDILKR